MKHPVTTAMAATLALAAQTLPGLASDAGIDAMIARHAAANGVPSHLVREVVRRESGFRPRASHAGNHGLMQIRHATARGMGYRGGAAGLLDAETNLTYAVPYLAGAYRAARGNERRAMAYYRSGYHGAGGARPARHEAVAAAQASAAAAAIAAAPAPADPIAALFGR